jgi:hypothetical protein
MFGKRISCKTCLAFRHWNSYIFSLRGYLFFAEPFSQSILIEPQQFCCGFAMDVIGRNGAALYV